MQRTCFNPRPIQKGQSARQSKRLRHRHGPWRRKEEQIHRQQDARKGVETQIRKQWQLHPVRYHQALVHGAEGPVKDADEHFEGRRAYREDILDAEEGGGGAEVCEGAGGEGEDGEGEADDGEELEVPAVGVVDGIGVVGEVFEGVEEGGETDYLGVVSMLVYGFGEGDGDGDGDEDKEGRYVRG